MGIEDDDRELAGDEDAAPHEVGTQRGVERDPSRYYEPGRLAIAVGTDGLPLVVGPPPGGPEPGLGDDNLVCLGDGMGRKPCRHLGQILVPAEGAARGFEQPKQIRRWCTRLATASELWEVSGDVYACTLRDPPDAKSAAMIDAFEAKQKQLARDAAEKSGDLDF